MTEIQQEGWRECIGLHTCDKRRTRSYLEKTFPRFKIEPGFKEEDELWTPDLQEPNEVQAYRIHLALERIFQEYQNATYISTTSHGGSINGLMDAVGHGRVPIMTGGMLPVVIKAVPANFPLHPPLVEWHRAPPCPAARSS